MIKPNSKLLYLTFSAAFLAASTGCNSPAGMAVQLVGKAVDSVDAQQLGDELIGQPPAAADAKLGVPVDAFVQDGAARKWRVYRVGALDVVGNQRYVAEIRGNSISGIAKVEHDPSGIDIAAKLLFTEKTQGKSPSECEQALGLGSPLLVARSEMNGRLVQVYDARTIKGIGSPKYCRLRFDKDDRCDEAHVVDVSASVGTQPPA